MIFKMKHTIFINIIFLLILTFNIKPLSSVEIKPEANITGVGSFSDRDHREQDKTNESKTLYIEENDITKTWCYANCYIGAARGSIRAFDFKRFDLKNIKRGTKFKANIKFKVGLYGLINSATFGTAASHYKAVITTGILEEGTGNWDSPLAYINLWAKTNNKDWQDWTGEIFWTTVGEALGQAAGEAGGIAVGVVWNTTTFALDALDVDEAIAQDAWVEFKDVTIEAGKDYRVYVCLDSLVKCLSVGYGDVFSYIDFYNRPPHFGDDGGRLLPKRGIQVKDVIVTLPEGLPVSGPDLKVDSVEVKPKSVKRQEKIKIKVTLSNVGERDAENFILSIKINDQIMPTKKIDRAKAGEKKEVEIDCDALLPGENSLVVTADLGDDVDEKDEDNNSLTYTNAFYVETFPDLFIAGTSVTPSPSITEGTPTELKVTVGNNYPEKTAEKVEVLVQIPAIEWEKSCILNYVMDKTEWKCNLPKLNQGMHQILVSVDPQNKIEEKNEENNQVQTYIEVTRALKQLRIGGISVSPSRTEYSEGDTITVKGEVENIGDVDLENVKVAFFYNKSDTHHIDLQEIGRKTVTIGKKSKKTVSLNWPAKKADYIYTDIYCIVDPDNKIPEQDESESLHSATVGITVKKKEVEEKPVEGKLVVEGIDLVVEDKDIFLEKQNFMASDYLGIWIHNYGNKSARGQVHLTASWIETDSTGKQRAVTQGLCQIGDTINQASSKLFKIYFKTLSNKGFMLSNHVKLIADVYPKEDANPSNNRAVFRIGNFDAIAKQLQGAAEEERETYYKKPDLTVIDIRNVEPPLKIGEKRKFQLLIKNKSTIDVGDFNVDCVIRPKGSGRPHPELGWKQFTKRLQQLRAGQLVSVPIEYTPIAKGVYEIVASITTIKWDTGWTDDADKSNNFLLKYFGIETAVDTGEQTSSQPQQPQRTDLDLAVRDIWIDNQTPNVGEEISGGFVVHNYSPVAINNVEWKVYSNADEVASGVINQIAANTSYTVYASSQADQEGAFTIKAVVDPYNKILETNENNNTITKELTITSTSQPISLPKVDVAVISVDLSKSHIKVGEDITVKATIKNQGSDAVNAIPVVFLVGDLTFSTQVIDSLAPGKSKIITAPLIGLMGGTYTITVIADRRGFIKEANEENNQRNAALVVERLLKMPLLQK